MKRIAQLGGVLLALTALFLTLSTAAADAATPAISNVEIVALSPTTATVAATVNLAGNAPSTSIAGLTSDCTFNYGTTAPASGSSPSPSSEACTPQLTAADENTTAGVAANLTGLSPATTYYIDTTVDTGGLAGLLATTTPGPVISFTTPSASVPPTVTSLSATSNTSTTATVAGSVNPENWLITSCNIEYGPSPSSLTSSAKCPTTPSGSTATPESVSLTGLSPATTYYYNVVVGYNSTVAAAGTAGSVTTPTSGTATTGAATSVSTTGAQLNATVNPQGQSVVSCTFYYFTGKSAAVAAPCAQSAAALSGQNANVPVTATLSGLTQGATYGYDILLVTATDTTAGQLGGFTTLKAPTATTHGPTHVTSTTATLNATVDTEAAGSVGCAFQYGVAPLPADSATGADSGDLIACTAKTGSTAEQAVSVALKGLAPGTVYYYRVIIDTSAGAELGATVKFETAKSGAKVTVPGMKILSSSIDTKHLRASFHFVHTGDAANSSQCGLATDTNGKVAKFTYKTCKSGLLYTGLKKTTYVFYVRGHNAAGYGKPASKKFTA